MLLLLGRAPELQQDRAVATFRTIFNGTAEGHEIYFFCLLFTIHNFCNKVEIKKRDRYFESPSLSGTSHRCSTTITATNTSLLSQGHISYAFYTAGINCLSNEIKKTSKDGWRCSHSF